MLKHGHVDLVPWARLPQVFGLCVLSFGRSPCLLTVTYPIHASCWTMQLPISWLYSWHIAKIEINETTGWSCNTHWPSQNRFLLKLQSLNMGTAMQNACLRPQKRYYQHLDLDLTKHMEPINHHKSELTGVYQPNTPTHLLWCLSGCQRRASSPWAMKIWQLHWPFFSILLATHSWATKNAEQTTIPKTNNPTCHPKEVTWSTVTPAKSPAVQIHPPLNHTKSLKPSTS